MADVLLPDHVGDDNDHVGDDDGGKDFDVPFPEMGANIPCRDLSRSKSFFSSSLVFAS